MNVVTTRRGVELTQVGLGVARFDYARAPEHLVSRAIAIARICASVVVGGRDGAQVAGTLERYNTPIPEAMWDELAASGLLAPNVVDHFREKVR